ncbi:hypothetical protein CDAR_462541 [Caerostris darwini]|uniref:Uncharacterized protein n=1 Tax=Caerostris darwini TaxID=1538125 RepID=A0AAV4WP21_9ARAC|nr:hypothetical protein CDAR_462541 [Caerostris darwini]
MKQFTNTQKADMHFICGDANINRREVIEKYEERFLHRRLSDPKISINLQAIMRSRNIFHFLIESRFSQDGQNDRCRMGQFRDSDTSAKYEHEL